MYKKDYIYEDMLEKGNNDILFNTLLIPDDDIDLLPAAEILKRRLLRSKYYCPDALCNNSNLLLLLLLHRKHITTEQIKYLNIFSNTSSAIGVKLSSMKKKNLIASLFIDKTKSNSKVYTITAEGLKALYPLPDRYLINNLIDYRQDNKREISASNINHDSALYDVFYYLLADTRFTKFQWIDSPVIHPSSTNSEILNHLSEYDNTNDYIRPDAIIIPWDNDNHGLIYVEQDMRTERSDQLKSKFNRYITSLNELSPSDIASTTILFNVKIEVDVNNMSITGIKKTYHDLEIFMKSISVDTLKSASDHLIKLIKDVRTITSAKKQNKKYNWYLTLHQFIKVVLSFNNKARTLEDAKGYIQHLENEVKKMAAENEKKESYKPFEKRLKTLNSVLVENELFTEMMMKGVSVSGSHNYALDTLPYILIREYETYNPLCSLLISSYLKFDSKYTYSPYGAYKLITGANINFRNLIKFNVLETPLFIENISHDLGAIYRFEQFIFNCNLEKDNVYFILVVRDVAAAVEITNKLDLANLLLVDNKINTSHQVKVFFYSYQEEIKDKLFVIGTNNQVISIK